MGLDRLMEVLSIKEIINASLVMMSHVLHRIYVQCPYYLLTAAPSKYETKFTVFMPLWWPFARHQARR